MERLPKMWRSALAMVLAVCMVIGFCPVAAFATGADEDVLNYVSFGASNANGYGLEGYMPANVTAENKEGNNVYGYMRMPVESYPYLLAEELNKVLGGTTARYNGNLKETQPFTKVNVSQLAMSSMRIEELRFLLDETYAGDSYTAWRFYGPGSQNWFGMAEDNLETLRSVYQNAIKNADVITLDMGINNFGVYISHQVGNKYGETLEDIDPELAAKFNEAKAQVKALAAQYAPDAVEMMEQMDGMIDALAYALAGFCVSFDVVMEKIQELNPDAKVVVVSIQNLLTGLSVELDGFEEALPLGDIFGAVINTANLYTASGSPYRESYLYADVRKAGRVEFFVDDLLAYNGDPATLTQNEIDCFTVYDDDLRVKSNISAMVDGYLAGQIEAALTPYLGYIAAVYGISEPNALLAAYLTDGSNGFAHARPILAAYGDLGAQCLAAMEGTYNVYATTRPQLMDLALTLAYDVLSELFQAGVVDHTINFSALASPNKGRIEDALLGKIGETVIGAIEALGNDLSYEFTLSEVYPEGFYEAIAAEAGMDVEIIKSVACMGIRTGIGNSFYGHPNPAGHQEIKDVIWAALKDEITGKDVVENEIKVVLGELKGFLEAYGPDAAKQAYDLWFEMGYQDMVNEYVAELVSILEARYTNYTEVVLPAMNGTVDALNAQKASLTAELVILKTQLEAKKAELEKVLAEQEIPEISAPDFSIDTEIGNNEQTEVPDSDCENAATELEAAIKDLEHAIAVVEALIADVTADINDMIALATEIAEAVASLEKTLTDVAAAAQALKDAVDAVVAVVTDDSAKGITKTFINAFNTAREAALTAAEALELLVASVDGDVAAIEAAVAVLEEGINALCDKFDGEKESILEQILAVFPEEEMMIAGLTVKVLKAALEAHETEIDAALEAKKAELIAELNGKLAEKEAELNAQLAALEAEYAPKIAEAEAALNAKLAEVEAEIAVKAAQLAAKAEAEIAELEAAAAEKQAALEVELQGYVAQLNALGEDAAEDVRAGIQAQIDRVTGDIATVNADLECAVGHVNAALKAAHDAMVEEVNNLYAQAVAQLQKAHEELVAAYEAAVAELKASYEAAIAELKAAYEAAVKELEDAVKNAIEGVVEQVRTSLEELKNNLINLGIDSIEALVEAVTAIVNDMLYQATHADLELDGNSTYVALGDGTAATESYVEVLAAQLQAEYNITGYTNYAAAGNTVGSALANIGSYTDLADAELITLGFGSTTMLNNAFANAMSEDAVDYNWADLVSAELAPYVEDALAEVYGEIASIGLDAETTAMLNTIVEGVAYGAVEYAVKLPQLIAAIREINADAVIVIVGQYNPMGAAVLKLGNVSVDVSEYIDYFVTGVAAHGIAYSIITGDAIFVEAPAVETTNTDMEWTVADLIKMLMNGFVTLDPSTAGDAYIANQILAALNITKVALWGDSDGNDKVTLKDAILTLQVANGKDVTIDRAVSDVTGDGKITVADAVWILKRANDHTDLFPVEK